MSTDIGIMQIPDADDLMDISNIMIDGTNSLWNFLNTHPTPVNVALLVQSIFQSFR